MTEIFSYDELRSKIEKTRAKTARFHRVDLHVHTIDSHDFPTVHEKSGFIKKVPEDEKHLKETPEEFKRRFVQRAKERSLRLVAVTDHHQSGMAEQLSAKSDGELTILPGIEIEVQTNVFPDSEVHILGIFPQGTPFIEIDKVFPPGCGMPSLNERGADSRTAQPIREILETIRGLGGICIAAHVSSTSGMRAIVNSQNVKWLQKNCLRRYLKQKKRKEGISEKEETFLKRLEEGLNPLDDEVQNAYLTLLAEYEFNAIQIQQWEHQQYYTGEHVVDLNFPPFPCILSTDTHTLADLGCRGHRTFIKMTEVGLEGLRKALRDPGTRICYDTTVPIEKPKQILGIAFEGGSFDGEIIGFSDNLTTLIGGRGTGKSALIEALRFVLEQPISGLPNRLRKDIESRLEFTLRDTEVKLLFADEQQEEFFVLKRRFGESRTSCFTLGGSPLPEIDLPTSQRIRAEIYGWNEIEELSDSPRKQLALLDRTIPGIEDLQLELKTGLEHLRVNGEEIVALAREIQNLVEHTQGSEEVRGELNRLSNSKLNEAFAHFDCNQEGLRTLERLRKEIEEVKEWLLDDGKTREPGQMLLQSFQEARNVLERYSWNADFARSFSQDAVKVQELYEHLLTILDEMKAKIDGHTDELQQERKSIETQLNILSEESGQSDFKTALSRRKELTDQLSKILTIEQEIQNKQRQISQLFETRREQIVPALNDVRRRIYQVRLEKTRTIAKNLAKLEAAQGVSIEIEFMRDSEVFSWELGHRDKSKTGGLFKNIDKHYLSKNYSGFYARHFLPHEFVEILLGDIDNSNSLMIHFIRERGKENGEIIRIVEGTIQKEGKELVEYDAAGKIIGRWSERDVEYIVMEEPEKVWKHLSPWCHNGEIKTYYAPQKLENLLKLELCDIEDRRPKILLHNNPIEELSPGQRCSALIPIILVEGQNPLIIDQPEDNLDNKLVFDLVVDILRGLKEHRQLIVATHNPNIPVSGDAEQVVVFDSPHKERCCAIEQASIDDGAIVRQIKTIMEGGDKAFEMRMKKYNLLANK